jgi:hypothetical protein
MKIFRILHVEWRGPLNSSVRLWMSNTPSPMSLTASRHRQSTTPTPPVLYSGQSQVVVILSTSVGKQLLPPQYDCGSSIACSFLYDASLYGSSGIILTQVRPCVARARKRHRRSGDGSTICPTVCSMDMHPAEILCGKLHAAPLSSHCSLVRFRS